MITIVGKEDVGDTLVVGDTYLDILYDATEQKGGLYETTDEGSIKVACFENRKQVELFENTMVRAIREYTDKVLRGETVESRSKGCWVGIDEEPHDEWECNNCGNVIIAYMEDEVEEHKYCHKCGARMSVPWADMEGEEND